MVLHNYTPVDTSLPRFRPEVLNVLQINPHKKEWIWEGTRPVKQVYNGKKVINTFYSDLKIKYPNLSKYTSAQIRKIILKFNELLTDTIVENRSGVALPEHIGTIFVGTYGKNTKVVDHKTSAEVGKKIYYKNSHSQRYSGKAFYVHHLTKHNFNNCQYWSFSPCRRMEIGMGKGYKENWKKYIVVPNTKYIQNFVRGEWVKTKLEIQNKSKLDKYNEFALD